MSWKQILKIDMDEARDLGEKYAPKDMEQGRKDIADRKEKLRQLQIEESLPKRRKTLQVAIDWMKDNPDYAASELGKAVQMSIDLAKEQLMEPEIFKRYITAIKSILATVHNGPYYRGPSKTSLIDRAKQANKDDPRMGSGR